MDSDLASPAVTGWLATPNHGRTTRPADIPASTARTMAEGTAKPMPIEPPVLE